TERVRTWAMEQQAAREGLGYRGQLGVGPERVHLVAEAVLDPRGERSAMRGAVIDPAALAGTVLPQAFERLVAELPADAERALLEAIFAMRVETPDTTVQLISLDESIKWSAVGSYLQPFTLGGLVPGWVIHVDWLNELKASGRRRMLANLIPLLIVVMGLVYVSRLAIDEMEIGAVKSAFVSNASHELKTPLTKIQFFNEMLESIPLADEEKRRRYHGVIAYECKRLRQLVDNVLDLSRIEDGRQRFSLRPVSIEELVSDVVETMAVMYADDGYEIALHAEPGLPNIEVDPQAVKQVVVNLIDNAIKFSKPHVIQVSVEKARRHSRPYVAVSVTDRGRGIPKEHLNDVFQEFYRVPDESGESTTGTGLGLALVRQIVQAHGGEIELESRVGQGSRFTMLLPARRHKEERSR
ncbi:MAG TPA: HAMP domain-containing sensor histidine kinase, partial [Rhodothermales bacterium]